jgi:flagellar biogenesis protein FliO
MDFLAATTRATELRQDYGSLIFVGCFFLVLIAVAIWWLRR